MREAETAPPEIAPSEVFIRHTSIAGTVDEETFFYSRETGGTVVFDRALEKMLEIARARYSTDR